MLKSLRISALCAASAALGFASAILLVPSLSDSFAASHRQPIVHASKSTSPVAPALNIVPADVMEPISPWSPLTSDGN